MTKCSKCGKEINADEIECFAVYCAKCGMNVAQVELDKIYGAKE